MENQEFRDMVYRYFRGQLNDAEYELLTNSLHTTENRAYFDLARKEWEKQPELSELGKQNLSRLQYQINRKNIGLPEKQNPRKLWIRIASAAAILVFGLLLGGVATYMLSSEKNTPEQIVVETPRGEKSMVKLPDGTEVWLNANSQLVYSTFSATLRKVELKGEAFFKVAHNEKVPFVVKTNECDIKVLGTTFNVMAYDEFGRKEITLIEGKVDVQTANENQVLKPGQSLIIKDQHMQVAEVNTSQASAWVDNKFNFKDIPLSELIQRLENWYDVDITLDNPSGREVNYTGTFKNEETIWQVLDAIQVYTSIEYQKSDTRQIKIEVK